MADIFQAVEARLTAAGVLGQFTTGLQTGTPQANVRMPYLVMPGLTQTPSLRTNTSRYDGVMFQLAVAATRRSSAWQLSELVEAALDDDEALLVVSDHVPLYLAAGQRTAVEELEFWRVIQDFRLTTQQTRVRG